MPGVKIQCDDRFFVWFCQNSDYEFSSVFQLLTFSLIEFLDGLNPCTTQPCGFISSVNFQVAYVQSAFF